MEGLGKREVSIRWIGWEAKAMGLKDLQSLQVWKDIDKTVHPLGQLDVQTPDRVEDAQKGRLPKAEYGIGISDLYSSETWSGSGGNCNNKWLQEIACAAPKAQFEGLKVLQRLQCLQIFIFSTR